MSCPSCVHPSAYLSSRGLPLGADAGDLHLGVTLAVGHPSPVAGLVLVLDDVDLGPGHLAQDLRGDLVMAKLARIADDLAIIDDKHGWQRHAGTNLTGKRVDGEDVVHRRLLLPATAAHDRVHRRTLSLLVRAQRAVPLGADHRHEEGLASFAPGTLEPSPGSVLCAGTPGYQTPAAADASDAACSSVLTAASGGPGSLVAARRRRRPPSDWPAAPFPVASAAASWPTS